MPLISKLRIRYERQVGFPGFSHIILEIEEEVLMEEGDTPDDVERASLSRMGQAVYAEMAPVVELYRQKSDKPAKPKKIEPPKKPPQRVGPPAPEIDSSGKPVETQQAAMPEAPVQLPKDREPGRDIPVYSEEGKRIRGTGQKRFIMAEINTAWQALFDAKIVETTPDHSKNVNTERQDIRVWLQVTPLDPKFSQEELDLVVESYGKWRGQGLTTQEAMGETANDYIGAFGGDSKDAGGGDQEAESGEDEAESEHKGVRDYIPGPDPDGTGATPGQGDPEATEAE